MGCLLVGMLGSGNSGRLAQELEVCWKVVLLGFKIPARLLPLWDADGRIYCEPLRALTPGKLELGSKHLGSESEGGLHWVPTLLADGGLQCW